MNDSNFEAEEIARREAILLENPDAVFVKVPVVWVDGSCLPARESEEYVEARFKVLTFGDSLVIEDASRRKEMVDGREKIHVDYNEMRRLSIKRCLESWSLDVVIERENGWLTPACYEQVGKIPAPLMEAMLDQFWKRAEITAEEETIISRQAGVLFGPSGRGVTDACEAVRLYCTLGSFSEKFSLTRDEVLNLALREYMMLKMMVGHENEAMRRNSKRNAPSGTKIAGPGGRTRPSSGKRIPL